jgi:hypothetical protein
MLGTSSGKPKPWEDGVLIFYRVSVWNHDAQGAKKAYEFETQRISYLFLSTRGEVEDAERYIPGRTPKLGRQENEMRAFKRDILPLQAISPD